MRTLRIASLFLAAALPAFAGQNTPASQSASTPAKRTAPQPAAQQAPGGGPDKVWVNNSSKVYHCPGDRYYGRTKDGQYMTEADAKKAGAHGVRNETCFK